MNDIPYQVNKNNPHLYLILKMSMNAFFKNDFTRERSPKGKIPWITLNGVDVADSQFCIEFLMKHFDKDLSKDLSPLERAIARAFLKLTEESLRWYFILALNIKLI